VYLSNERILKPNFNEYNLGKLHETMQFSMYAVTALMNSNLTKIFLTAILCPASYQINNTCKHVNLTAIPNFEDSIS
jgi:hypothetical protein